MQLALIVEDNEKNLRLTRDVLEYGGFRTLEARCAEDGIAIAREHHPDVILMDIQLPGMDGVAALHELRADPQTAAIPVVAITAFAMNGDKRRMLDAGFDHYVPKPIDIDHLADDVRSVCGGTTEAV